MKITQKKKISEQPEHQSVKIKSKRKTANAFIKHSIHFLSQQWKSLSPSPGALVTHTLHNTLHLPAQKNHLFLAAAAYSCNHLWRYNVCNTSCTPSKNIVQFTQATMKSPAGVWQQQSQSTVSDFEAKPLCGRNGTGAVLLFALFFLMCKLNWIKKT